MAKTNYTKLGVSIVDLAGGAGNILSVTNCATRVRLRLADDSKADIDAIKKLDGVMGAVFNIGQLQIVIGPDVVEVVAEVNKAYRAAGGKPGSAGTSAPKKAETEDGGGKNPLARIGRLFIDFLSASIRPVVPAFFGGGMIKVYIVLVNLLVPGFSASQTALLLGYVANAPFYFLPVLIAYGVAQYYGSNPMYPMIIALGLMYPDFAEAVANGQTMSLFGISVPLISYSSQVLPTMMTSVLAHYVELGVTRITPRVIKNPIVGPVTLSVSFSAGLLVLGPIGTYLTNAVSAITAWCSTNIGFITMPLIAAALPFLVMTGLGSAFLPLMSQAMEDPGYDGLFRPALTLHNMAEGATCLGVALKTKDTELRSSCWTMTVGGIVAGVSEPVIFGLDLPYKTPLYAVSIGGAAGGLVASIMGVKAYVMGYSTILALPIYEDTMIGMAVAIAVTIVSTAVISYILWNDRCLGKTDSDSSSEAPQNEKINLNYEAGKVFAPIAGKYIPLSEVSDPVFAQGTLGQGCGIEPAEGKVYAPVDGTVETIADTNHAIGILSDDGIEYLIHVGMDTVDMNGRGFTPKVAVGGHVTAGQLIMEFDMDEIKKAGHPTTTAFIVINSDEYGDINLGVEQQHEIRTEIGFVKKETTV